MKAANVYGGGAVFDSISCRDGGWLMAADKKAKLVGLEEGMAECVSRSPRADVMGCGDSSRGDGLGVK